MCANFRQTFSRKTLVDEFQLLLAPALDQSPPPKTDIFPKYFAYLIRAEGYDPILDKMTWGLPPRDTSYSNYNTVLRPFNARAETIDKTFPFKLPWKDGTRCVIPASNFIEWPVKDGKKIKTQVHMPKDEIMFIAGLWDETETGHRNFTMITADPSDANEHLVSGKARERLPVILEDWRDWLNPDTDPDEAKKMLRPWRSGLLGQPS